MFQNPGRYDLSRSDRERNMPITVPTTVAAKIVKSLEQYNMERKLSIYDENYLEHMNDDD